MPISGNSLVGFMDPATAGNYLRGVCVLPDKSDAAVLGHIHAARERLGAAPMDRAGLPEILPIPQEYASYLNGVGANPRFNDTVMGVAWSFQLVEIDPLLAYQFHVVAERSAGVRDAADAISVGKMLEVCLPHGLANAGLTMVPSASGVLIRSSELNVRMLYAGILGGDAAQGVTFAGLRFGLGSPLVQVVRFGGRCYLRNGFHRANGLRQAGATHVPCLLLEASDFSQIGAVGGGATFDRALLESAAPPTCGHFAQGRAYPVQLRKASRMIHVTWAEYICPDED